MSRIDDITTYTRDGETWEVRHRRYTRLDGQPCTYIELRGDPATFFYDTEILQVREDAGEWAGYWHLSGDPDLRANEIHLVELYEQARARGRDYGDVYMEER